MDLDDFARAHRSARALVTGIEQVIRGQHRTVEHVVCALLAGGHVLLEDGPGSGKTTLARSLARSVGATTNRISATPDLLPADITGAGMWRPGQPDPIFVPGPVFAQVVLVDELNRASPRTQSAFLEAMSEGSVTVDGVTHPLPQPFFVIATQNPLEHHGTFPLPEAQLDRFMVCTSLDELSEQDELRVVSEQLSGTGADAVPTVLTADELLEVRRAVGRVHVAPSALTHAVGLVRATRSDPRIAVGASPRAAIALVRCARARALVHGRDYLSPDDTKALAGVVLAHRIVPVEPGGNAASILESLASAVPVPLAA